MKRKLWLPLKMDEPTFNLARTSYVIELNVLHERKTFVLLEINGIEIEQKHLL